MKSIFVDNLDLQGECRSQIMELATLYYLGSECLALEINFAYNEMDFEGWGRRFIDRFGGTVDGYGSSPRGSSFELRIRGLKCHLVQVSQGGVWLVTADRAANQAIKQIYAEIQESLAIARNSWWL